MISEGEVSNRTARLVAFHEANKIAGIDIKNSSRRYEWKDVYACTAQISPFSASFSSIDSLLVFMINEGQMNGCLEVRGEKFEFSLRPETVFVLPIDVPFKIRVTSHATVVSVNISRSLLNDVFIDFSYLSATMLSLKSSHPLKDAFLTNSIGSVVKLLSSEWQFSSVEVEYLARSIAARIISKYSTSFSDRESAETGLTLVVLQRVLDFIEENLHRRINIDELAPMAGVGNAQFARLFKRATNVTLHQYIIKQRVEMARHLLIDTQMPIAEIAHECGFADQVHLTRLFGRIIGLSPAPFRRKHSPYL